MNLLYLSFAIGYFLSSVEINATQAFALCLHLPKEKIPPEAPSKVIWGSVPQYQIVSVDGPATIKEYVTNTQCQKRYTYTVKYKVNGKGALISEVVSCTTPANYNGGNLRVRFSSTKVAPLEAAAKFKCLVELDK